ncbi:DUF998 domain-containing protein [Streptomyces tsukubensis]|uniref:DUF998 domain-containing protein n=1 Tax=Streptomyces tsukubensis TaxID=83656 RepID=A0A1V4ACF7_9ACTN|nr:DUF998 domain-containing protein [Streptomyces tsukubensis]OON81587.1 hypothetical protein B1H18_05255 [Streptomyces tsukubensis]QFR96359.1 DUF998 domain-containing protein [Streptomyces tsukubensis]
MRLVPWWALVSSGCAPVLLIGGSALAERWQGPGYDPVTKTISVLAAYGAPGYWLMTGVLVGIGASYVVTAVGLRAAALAGRVALACAGLDAMVLTLAPAPLSGGSFGHGSVATVGFALLAVWPVLAADREGPAPWGLRPGVTATASAVMFACAAWLLVAVLTQGVIGVAERVLTFLQALWPLLVVVSCLGRAGRDRPLPWFSRRRPPPAPVVGRGRRGGQP